MEQDFHPERLKEFLREVWEGSTASCVHFNRMIPLGLHAISAALNMSQYK
jgi:hypothetical protein